MVEMEQNIMINASFLPNAIRSSEPNDKPLKIEDYQIDKRLDFGGSSISINDIIKENGEIGSFELGNLKITINSMDEYQNDLIKI